MWQFLRQIILIILNELIININCKQSYYHVTILNPKNFHSYMSKVDESSLEEHKCICGCWFVFKQLDIW